MATNYVRLTVRQNGRNRTVWAERRNPNGFSFWVVNKQGDRPEPNELIIASEKDCKTILPARMSLKYCWLCPLDDPDLNNEIDGRTTRPSFEPCVECEHPDECECHDLCEQADN